MSNEKARMKISARSRGEGINTIANLHSQIVGDRTLFNLQTYPRRYKLARAYVNVKNLEYRGSGAIRLQTFQDY
jgi:hypothetical protein